MNAIDFEGADFFCVRAPALGITRCEHSDCAARAGYLCCAVKSGEHWEHGRRLCQAHAAPWCVEHSALMPPSAHPLLLRRSDGSEAVELVDDVAGRLALLIDFAPERLRAEWDRLADAAGAHWLSVAVADLIAWPLADGGLDALELSPTMMDNLLGALHAHRAHTIAAAVAPFCKSEVKTNGT